MIDRHFATRSIRLLGLLAGIAFPGLAASTAVAQIAQIDPSIQLAMPGQTAAENVSAVAARSPGNLVSAGVAQALHAADIARGGVEIIETESQSSIGDQLLADSITIVFDQLNQAIAMFESLLRLRAGRSVIAPGASGAKIFEPGSQFEPSR